MAQQLTVTAIIGNQVVAGWAILRLAQAGTAPTELAAVLSVWCSCVLIAAQPEVHGNRALLLAGVALLASVAADAAGVSGLGSLTMSFALLGMGMAEAVKSRFNLPELPPPSA